MNPLDEAVAQLAAGQYGAFSRDQAYAAGGSSSAADRRLASGRWQSAGRTGVYILPGYPPSWHQRLVVAVLAGPVGTRASHRSVAALLGVRAGEALEVTVPRRAQNRLSAVCVHQAPIQPADRQTISGIPATKIDRTLLDLAAVVGDDAVEQAVEAALRKGLTSADRLQRYLEAAAGPGRRGVARLRRVLQRRSAGRPSASVLEVKVIQLLREAGLGEPVRQHEVRIGGARYFLDLAFPDRRLAIELDGFEHHGGAAAFQHDRRRQNALVLAGWTVLRFTWADVMERPDDVVAVVTRALAAA